MPPSQRSSFRSWKPATFIEMKAFIGVILNMGLIQLSQLKDYWMTHETINLQFFVECLLGSLLATLLDAPCGGSEWTNTTQ